MASNQQQEQIGGEDLKPSEASRDSDDSKLSPNSPDKNLTLTETQSPASNTSSSSSGKGKAKMEEETDSAGTCGICFLEDDGQAIRGWIDSCNHFFCFVCIMEWAKVESRCPLCKARFSIIRRAPKDGLFSHERVVNVPVRDQVYHPLGNGTVGPYDPYAQTLCTECQSSKDENLLLLCDLCDSAAHTYCVGLGVTVPEGDWYCHDCSVLRNEHPNNQMDGDSCNQDYPRNFDTIQGAASDFSISDIIRDETAFYEVPQQRRTSYQMHGNQIGNRPSRTTIAKESQGLQSSSPAVVVREREHDTRTSLHSDDRPLGSTIATRDSQRLHSSSLVTPIKQGARTLRRCRKLHGRIRALRANWSSLRSGSMSFPSSIPDSGGASNNRRYGGRAVTSDYSSQPQSSSSVKCDGVSSDMLKNRDSYDVDRAWKMMDIAKSVQKARGGAGFDQKNSNCLAIKRKFQVEANHASTSSLMSNSKPSEKASDIITSENNCKNYSLEPLREEHKCQKYEKQKLGRDMMNSMSQIDKGPTGPPLLRCREMQSAKQFRKSSHVEVSRGNGKSKLVNVQKGKSGRNKNAKVMLRKDDGAKSEVQSLVKLNLKMLSCGRQLGADKFKEIAKLATHTILAACGLEHSKSSARSFPISICRHIEHLQQLHVSNLMTSSCRECFYVFVKDVVNSIMAEKTNIYCT
ncbi:uncharacterized protein LOC131258096 isoform X2 [Magnolia sinica]|uniref:uncharacterized protein LOC131258096 isoform X2 n=1 Tax=Magnolia sinica TaxID=86752 RepID=UPI0026588A42|nr:uncharacterized protein LOC131258096 isoform X2 [Magnolia sinica]